MAGASDLTGTIGTWVAVFLAFVALAGILPAYLIYQRSRTTKSRALASVDDPDQTFVSQSFTILGMRINQRVKVPDLRDPLDQRCLDPPGTINATALNSLGSTTYWVNFAHLVKAMFPYISSSRGDKVLCFKDDQNYLPDHCVWLLLLGVLHRCTFRKDYGLPLGLSPQEHRQH